MSEPRPLLVLAEFRCTPEGDVALREQLPRTLAEVRATPGCLQAGLGERPAERRYLFTTYWADGDGVGRRVENEFQRSVRMPGFSRWCSEGSFGELRLEADHDRARRCGACARWTSAPPGWSEASSAACRQCGASLADG